MWHPVYKNEAKAASQWSAHMDIGPRQIIIVGLRPYRLREKEIKMLLNMIKSYLSKNIL